jgi:hypothetical protein
MRNPGGGVRVVPEQFHQYVQQDALAVVSGAEEEGQDLAADVPGDRVAEQKLQVGDHLLSFGVVAEGAGQEPFRAR